MRDDARSCEHRTDSHAYRIATVCVMRDGQQTSACTTDPLVGMAIARAWIPIAQEAARAD
jgi:hypothetical protein